MAISIVVPQLGESVAEGTVARWLKAVGDKVRKEEPIVEIQTDKINVEIPSPADGTLSGISVPEGTTVLVGTEIGQISGAGEAATAPAAAPAAAKAAAGTASIAPATAVAAPPMPAASAPAMPHGNGSAQTGESAEGRNPSRGAQDHARAGRDHGRTIGHRGLGRRRPHHATTCSTTSRAALRRPRSPPPPRRLAPAAAKAAGPVPSFLARVHGRRHGPARDHGAVHARAPRDRREHGEGQAMTAHTHCFDECDMSSIVALKKEWAPKLEAQGVKLTYMPFFIKATVFALKEFPWMNSSVTPQGDAITVKHYYNIGIAVGRDEKGLIVPNLKDCDRKNLVQLAGEVNDLAARARADRLGPDDIQGGTFSITNAGVFGAINSAPVINVPEVGILGVHKIVERAVVKKGQIVIAPMMNAVIGFDHRAVDGELAVKFLRRFCELIEKPELLWFHA